MTVPPVAAFVSRVSVKEHEMLSKIEIPQGWLVAFPRFEKALQLLKKTRKYVDSDWTKLDGNLEALIYLKVAGLGPRKGISKVPYGPHFTAVRGNSRLTRGRFAGVRLAPKSSSQNFSQRQKLLMAQRPKPDRCEACDRPHAVICWDHDHTTGLFRGWICQDCNIALGCVSDSPDRMRNLVVYIEKFQERLKAVDPTEPWAFPSLR